MNWKEDRREKVVEKQFYKRNQIDNHYDLRFCMDDLMVYKKNIFISIYNLTFNYIMVPIILRLTTLFLKLEII